MEGRIRLLTAILPSYAHPYQALCLTRCSADIPFQRFRLPSAKAKYLTRTTELPRKKKGGDCQGWASCLAWSLPLRRILRMLGLDSIPTSPQNSRVLLRHYPSLDPRVPSLAVHKIAFFYDPKHAANMYGNDTCTQECSVGLDQPATVAPSPIDAAYHHAACLQSWAKRGNECADHAAALGALGFVSN